MSKKLTPEQLAASGTEHGNQAALFCWINLNLERWDKLSMLFAIPNGGFRDKITASNLKAEGVKAGVPDMMLPVPMTLYHETLGQIYSHGLFIELKRPTSKNKRAGVLNEDTQSPWLTKLAANGYSVVVCYGWEQARNALVNYLLQRPLDAPIVGML